MKRSRRIKCGIYRRGIVDCDDVWRAILWLQKNNPLVKEIPLNPFWAQEFMQQEQNLGAAMLRGNISPEAQGKGPGRGRQSSVVSGSQSSQGSQSRSQVLGQESLSQGSQPESEAGLEEEAEMGLADVGDAKGLEEDVLVVTMGGDDRENVILANIEKKDKIAERRATELLEGQNAQKGRKGMVEAVDDALQGNDVDLAGGEPGQVRTKEEITVAPGEGQRPLPLHLNENADVASFVTLFPDGTRGMNWKRSLFISNIQYMMNRLRHKDPRFQRHNTYIFFLASVYQNTRLESQISMQLNKAKANVGLGRPVTAADVQDAERLKQLKVNDYACNFMRDIRGSPKYWEKVKPFFG